MKLNCHYFHLTTTRGHQFKLKEKDFDLRGKRAFNIVECQNGEKPIECMLTNEGEIILVDGHHTIGFYLGNGVDCNKDD